MLNGVYMRIEQLDNYNRLEEIFIIGCDSTV